MDNFANSVDKWGDFVDKSESKFLFSKKDIATIFDVDEKAVYKWVKQNGCPTKTVGKSKKYDIREVIKWRNQKTGNFTVDEEEDISSLPANEQLIIYKCRDAKNSAELKEIKVQLQKGELLDKKQVQSNITECLLVFKKTLLTLTNQLVAEFSTCVPPEKHRKLSENIDSKVKDCLNDLARGLEYVG